MVATTEPFLPKKMNADLGTGQKPNSKLKFLNRTILASTIGIPTLEIGIQTSTIGMPESSYRKNPVRKSHIWRQTYIRIQI